jgi:dTDP-4-amino-4,6-dideoxygalactose transaminase
MITTLKPDWDRQVRLWRHHGMGVPDRARHEAREVIFESYPVLGYNYRMTDIQGAMGREQLKRLPEIIERRRFLAKRYRELLADIPGIGLPEEPDWARSNWQSYCVRLPDGCDQHQVMQFMLDQGISTRRGVMCAHREAAYASISQPLPLIESEKAQDKCVLLPIFHQMTEADQDRVAATIREALL